MFSTPTTFGKKVPLGACPVGFGASASLAVAVTTADKVVACSVAKQEVVAEVKLGFSPTCVAVAPSDGLLAVGGEDNLVHLLNPDASEKSTLARHPATFFGALARNRELTKSLRIVPVGLNYYRGHRFRGSVFVEYGEPISVPPGLVDAYAAGGAGKRVACTELLDRIRVGLSLVTLQADDAKTMAFFRRVRRMYAEGGRAEGRGRGGKQILIRKGYV